MRAAAFLLLAGCAVLAACKPEPVTPPALNEAEAAAAGVAPDVDKVMGERWEKLFGNPAAAIAAAKEFDYQASGYTAAGSSYRTASPELTMTDKDSPILVTSDFTATGPKSDKLDTVTFKFTVAKLREPKTQKEEFPYRFPVRVIQGFLARFELNPDDRIKAALVARKSESEVIFGTTITVKAEPIAGGRPGDTHLIVTFNRTGANRPANN